MEERVAGSRHFRWMHCDFATTYQSQTSPVTVFVENDPTSSMYCLARKLDLSANGMTTCETSSQLDKCCTNVESEPYLTELQGETFELRTAINSSSGARLDIKARNYLRQGQNTYFDIE